LTLVEKYQRGNALHAVLLRHGSVAVHVNLNDAHLAPVLGSYLLQNGRHGFAWPAPSGVEIDQHGHAGAVDEFGKGLTRHGKTNEK
jgi:hypothetical protein